MAVPTLQAQGTIAAVTTGNLSVTIPAYAAYDIVVIAEVAWFPNTPLTPGWGPNTLSSPWQIIAANSSLVGVGLSGLYWARATSTTSLGTSVTITRGTGQDTGADTCWAGRAYVIRNCDPNGDPFENVPTSTEESTVANPQIPAEQVYGENRLVIHFMNKTDNAALPTAATGYTVGTLVTSTTGTDAGFQTYRLAAARNATISAVTPTGGVVPAQGGSYYCSVVFKPNDAYRVLVT